VLAELAEAAQSLAAQFATVWVPIQLGLILAAALIGWSTAAIMRRRVDLLTLTMSWPIYLRLAIRAFADNLGIILTAFLLLALRMGMQEATWPSRSYLLGVAASLAAAWIAIALATSLIRNEFFNRIVAVFAWTLAALSILGLLQPVRDDLDQFAVVIGGLRISALLVLKTTVLLLMALWAASAVGNFIDTRIRSVPDLTPSIKVLLGKLIRTSLITFAVLAVLSSVGIDFSALALFSGAVGVGVGFGLQKIVSNLVAGIILLADKSIKPGDVITVGDSFGWVETMGARYTSVVSRDGRECLIPNEDFVTQRVVNWSYTGTEVRFNVDFGVDVVADPHQVRRVAIEAVKNVPRVLSKPPPTCHFMAFGSKSLDFSLRFWINDPQEGATSVKSAVLFALWDALKRECIPIPPPVQDLRFIQPVEMVMKRDGTAV
jgi:small-conductance mechanosensitive channel